MKIRRVAANGVGSGASGPAVTFFYGLIDLTPIVRANINTNITTTHIGFFIENDVLYTSTANGSGQTKNTVSGFTLSNYNVYQIVRESDRIDFYVNGTLVRSHTTNLPSFMDTGVRFCFGLDSGVLNAQSGAMHVGNVYTLDLNP